MREVERTPTNSAKAIFLRPLKTSMQSTKKKGAQRSQQVGDDVVVMEARLKLLKEQMEAERKKRQDAVSKSGTGSIWMNGRVGAMRGVRDVRALVRTNVRELQARPQSGTSATSAADTETTSPTEQLDERPWTPGPENSDWTPAQRGPDGGFSGSNTDVAPAAPDATSRPATAPKTVQVAAMECQTEPTTSARTRGSEKSGTRPTKRAVATTYLGKILQARKQQQQ